MSRSVRAPLVGVACVALLLPASVAHAQPSPSPAPAAQQAVMPIKPPVPNRFNELLPGWLRVRAEFRERVEGFQGAAFTPDRDDAYSLSRLRVNASVTASKSLSFVAQVQDARVAEKEVGPTTAPFRGPFDLRLGYADIGSTQSHVAFRVGRQELAYGEQRLLGHLAWVNTGRSWDAARITLRSKPISVDVFGASLVRSLPDTFDKSGNGNRLFGAYGTAGSWIPQGTVEPFVFFRRDENLRSELGVLGTLNQTTTGVRLAGKLPARLDYGVDMALQRGSLDTDDISSWAGHWQIRETFPGKYAVKLISEYNHATGDEDARDGVRQTFDQLYPTGHDKLGLSDQVGWKNIRHLREGFEFSPFKATPISVSYHSWWLAEKADGLYGANGALLARVTAASLASQTPGADSSHVGQELDLQISRAVTPQIALSAGYSHIFSGAFLKQATPGASYSQPYVMVTYVFLAEK